MPDTPTPGQVAYEAHWYHARQQPALAHLPTLGWWELHAHERAAWETAAQAVLAQATATCGTASDRPARPSPPWP